MSRIRTQNWHLFSKRYLLYNAEFQCPMLSGELLSQYLLGKHKRIYAPGEDVGDFVVVSNSQKIAMKDNSRFWDRFMYPIYTRFATKRYDVVAKDLHSRDPTDIIKREVRMHLPRDRQLKIIMERLLVFPDDKIPKNILMRVSAEIPPLFQVPERLDQISSEELVKAEKLFDFPMDFKFGKISPIQDRLKKVKSFSK